MVGAVGSEQARFGRNEADRMTGVNRCAAHLASIGIEAARAVKGEHGAAVASSQQVGVANQLGVGTGSLALQTDAEQSVDDQ